MDNKRKRPYLERACKKKREDSAPAENATDALYLDPKLWSKLPLEVADRVLSYVPIHRFFDTLLRVDRTGWWAKQLRSPAFGQMFGHGNNLNSSYGVVMVEDPQVPRLIGFDQESQRWFSFSQKLLGEMKKAKMIFMHGSRDGLMLCESRRRRFSGRLNLCNCSQSHLVRRTEVGVWNPLLCSFKWLPKNVHLIDDCNPPPCRYHYTVMMVHEPSRTYRVFLCLFYLPQVQMFYSVYDSTTGSWRSSKGMPYNLTVDLETWRRVASCDRYIFFPSFQNRLINSVSNEYVREYYIYWYDAEKDMWGQVFLSEILQQLGFKADNLKNPPYVENFVILHGVLYMLIRMVHLNEERSGSAVVEGQDVCFLASMDLSALGVVEFGVASSIRFKFKFEAFVPDEFHVRECRERISPWTRLANFKLYCYTMKGKGYIGLQTSKSGHFLYYDVSRGDWSKHYQSLEVGGKNWETGQAFFHFKPSLVLP